MYSFGVIRIKVRSDNVKSYKQFINKLLTSYRHKEIFMSNGVSFYDGGQAFVTSKEYDTQPSASPSKGGPVEGPCDCGHSMMTSQSNTSVPGSNILGSPLDA